MDKLSAVFYSSKAGVLKIQQHKFSQDINIYINIEREKLTNQT